MRGKFEVNVFAVVRRDSRMEGLSIWALVRKYDVHRRTVREALPSAWLACSQAAAPLAAAGPLGVGPEPSLIGAALMSKVGLPDCVGIHGGLDLGTPLFPRAS